MILILIKQLSYHQMRVSYKCAWSMFIAMRSPLHDETAWFFLQHPWFVIQIGTSARRRPSPRPARNGKMSLAVNPLRKTSRRWSATVVWSGSLPTLKWSFWSSAKRKRISWRSKSMEDQLKIKSNGPESTWRNLSLWTLCLLRMRWLTALESPRARDTKVNIFFFAHF